MRLCVCGACLCCVVVPFIGRCVCPSFSLRSLGTQWRCVEVKGSLSLLRLTPIVEDECEEGAYLLLMLVAVHFSVMVTFSCPCALGLQKPAPLHKITEQSNVCWILGGVAGESMALTPPPFLETNEMVCACSPPSVCGGLQTFLLLWHSLVLLNEVVCAPCPLDGSWRRRSLYVLLLKTTPHILFEAGMASKQPPTLTVQSGCTRNGFR